jgi:hypothetical protein
MNDAQLNGAVAMSNEEYHSGPGISASHLKFIAQSPLHYWDQYINPDRPVDKKTPAKMLGTAIHTVLLEPDEFTTRYAVAPECDRRTTVGKKIFADFEAENLGKIILTAEQWERCESMRSAVHQDPYMAQLLSIGVNEQSFFMTDRTTGELIKCRPDKLRSDHQLILDVKSADDASPEGFGWAAEKFGYYRAAAWYTDILQHLTGEPHSFAFVVAESERPFAVGVYYVEPSDLQLGRDENRILLDRIHRYRDHVGKWPGYITDPQPLKLPSRTALRVARAVAEEFQL